MPKIKILTSQYADEMEQQINDLLSEGYQMHGGLTTYNNWHVDKIWERDRKALHTQITYFMQVMIKKD